MHVLCHTYGLCVVSCDGLMISLCYFIPVVSYNYITIIFNAARVEERLTFCFGSLSTVATLYACAVELLNKRVRVYS